jgi:hypothetical protein
VRWVEEELEPSSAPAQRSVDVIGNGKLQRFVSAIRENQRGKYHCTIDLLLDWFDWFGISFVTTEIIFVFICRTD